VEFLSDTFIRDLVFAKLTLRHGMGGTDALTLTIILNRFGSVCLESACLLGP